MEHLDLISSILVILGMAAGIIRDASRARAEEIDFDWMAWLGERPLQLAGRLALALAVIGPGGDALITKIMEGGQTIPPEAAAIPTPFLAGYFGDRLVKKALEAGESFAERIPGLGWLVSVGKKLT